MYSFNFFDFFMENSLYFWPEGLVLLSEIDIFKVLSVRGSLPFKFYTVTGK